MTGGQPAREPGLSHRHRKILYAVVSEYITNGEPIGSRTLSKGHGIDLSAATIRTVLADLEEAGYLVQPHASAGRVPTDAGFRLFVDALVQMREVTAEHREIIVGHMKRLRSGEGNVTHEVVRLLSLLTGTAAMWAPPRVEDEALSQLRFIPLRARTLLAVIVTRSGTVQNRVVGIPHDVDDSELERIHNYLTSHIVGRTLTAVRDSLATQIESERSEVARLRKRAKAIVDATLLGSDEAAATVVVEGHNVLLAQPEFTDPEKIRGLLKTLEEKERLIQLLNRTMDSGGVQVLIGSETHLDTVQDVSIVAANYRSGGASTGTLGVLGPTRMDYAKVVPLVSFTAQAMSDVLDTQDAGNEDETPEDSRKAEG